MHLNVYFLSISIYMYGITSYTKLVILINGITSTTKKPQNQHPHPNKEKFIPTTTTNVET